MHMKRIGILSLIVCGSIFSAERRQSFFSRSSMTGIGGFRRVQVQEGSIVVQEAASSVRNDQSESLALPFSRELVVKVMQNMDTRDAHLNDMKQVGFRGGDFKALKVYRDAGLAALQEKGMSERNITFQGSTVHSVRIFHQAGLAALKAYYLSLKVQQKTEEPRHISAEALASSFGNVVEEQRGERMLPTLNSDSSTIKDPKGSSDAQSEFLSF